eukprot:gene1502-888_t
MLKGKVIGRASPGSPCSSSLPPFPEEIISNDGTTASPTSSCPSLYHRHGLWWEPHRPSAPAPTQPGGSWERAWEEAFSLVVPAPLDYVPPASAVMGVLQQFPQGPATARAAFFSDTSVSNANTALGGGGGGGGGALPASASPSPSQPHLERTIAFVGHQNAGKTTLLQCFRSGGSGSKLSLFYSSLPDVTGTVGVETAFLSSTVYSSKRGSGAPARGNSNAPNPQEQQLGAVDCQYPVVLRVLDCAGHPVYTGANNRFLTDQSIFVFVWDVSAVEVNFRVPNATAQEELLLQSHTTDVLARFPNATVVLVATHLDKLRDQDKAAVEQILTKMELRMWEFIRTVFKQHHPPLRDSRLADGVEQKASFASPLLYADPTTTTTTSTLGTTRASRICGNFAVSCASRQMVAAGRQRGSTPSNLSTVFTFLTHLAKHECMKDPRYGKGFALPSLHIQLYAFLQSVEKACPDRVLLSLQTFRLAARRIKYGGGNEDRKKAAEAGPTNEKWDAADDAEVLASIRFLHDRGSIFWFDRHAAVPPVGVTTSTRASATTATAAVPPGWWRSCSVVSRPNWLYRLSNCLFSLAHVLSTPRHLRSTIDGIPYLISKAEEKDQLLLRKGYLRWPLAQLLFYRCIEEVCHHFTDADVGVCLSLLAAMDLLYPVQVPCDDPNLFQEELPYPEPLLPGAPTLSNRQGQDLETTTTTNNNSIAGVMRVKGMTLGDGAPSLQQGRDSTGSFDPSPPPLARPSTTSILRFFVPSFAPRDCPETLCQIAPLLFHRGLRRRFIFNALPWGVWHRLQCRLHRLYRLVSLHHPTPVNELQAMEEDILFEHRPREADDEHNRWRDAMWLWLPPSAASITGPNAARGSRGLRAFVFRQAQYPCHVFFYSSEAGESAKTLALAVEQEVHRLLAEYPGITVASSSGCENAELCENWVPDSQFQHQSPAAGGEVVRRPREETPPSTADPPLPSSTAAAASSEKGPGPVIHKAGRIVGRLCPTCGTPCHSLAARPAPDRHVNSKVLARYEAPTKALLASTLPLPSCWEVNRILGLQLYDEESANNNGTELLQGTAQEDHEDSVGAALDKVVEVALYHEWTVLTKRFQRS